MGEISINIRSIAEIPGSIGRIEDLIRRGIAGGAVVVTLGRTLRSLNQNKKMWPMLNDVSRQCELCINGRMVNACPEDWKDVFASALKNETRVAEGLDGKVVFLGSRTSKLNKEEFSQLIEIIYAYGAENGVAWSEPALKAYEQYGVAA